jgi:NAD(P)-dependent dehydrogenase (short-subunit alcohol dehydrogenase family)
VSGRFVVVTGASRGLGRSIALELAGAGFTVFAGVRRDEDGAELAAAVKDRVRPLLLDVASGDSIAAAAAEVERETSGTGLAGLVNR